MLSIKPSVSVIKEPVSALINCSGWHTNTKLVLTTQEPTKTLFFYYTNFCCSLFFDDYVAFDIMEAKNLKNIIPLLLTSEY